VLLTQKVCKNNLIFKKIIAENELGYLTNLGKPED
jgi:hypothetical protein